MEYRIIRGHFPILFGCCLFMATACINEIPSENPEIQEGDIPITFSVHIEESATKITDDVFDANDQIGLYALISGSSMADERYIDNLLLTCGEDQELIPEKDVYYPEGDNSLDFIAYYPYNPEGAEKGETTIPVNIQPNQEDAADYSASDFLTATKNKVAGSGKPVSLDFEHRLAKLKIKLSPKNNDEAEEMRKDNPHIVATGFYTQADYDLETGKFSNFKNVSDITPTGEWKMESGKLAGKEFIFLPQEISSDQVFQLDWNGRIYTCPIPTVEALDGNAQYEIEISTEEIETNRLNGFLASISGWSNDSELNGTESENGAQVLHLSALSFEASNIYRVHLNGKEVAEICKEYLSDDLDSRAITIYPIKNGATDLKKGTVLQLLDTDEEMNGGKLQWDFSDNTFTYYEGDLPHIQTICFDQEGNLYTDDKPEQPAEINVVAYTLSDQRNPSDIQQYPIVKIGTQYWLRENLRADRYSNGNPMEKLTVANGKPGYHVNNGNYFYNGEALEKGTMCPEGWGIPSLNDWKCLDEYIEHEVSVLKTGEWKKLGTETDKELAPVNNKTMFSIKPLGIWSYKSELPDLNDGKMAAFWTWDDNENKIPENAIFFTGGSNTMIESPTRTTPEESKYGTGPFYKGLSIRLIKK